MKNKRIFFVLLLVFIGVNIIFTINYLGYESSSSDSEVGKRVVYTVAQPAADPAADTDRITLKLKIFDIFRLDISCDYIMNALAERIDDRYRNEDKKCALASTSKNANLAVDRSYAKTTNDVYEPLLDAAVAFNPFDIKLVNASQLPFAQLKNLAAGGLWSPRFSVPDRECSDQDVEFIVFIVPYTQSRLANLKLFLLNMHSYLQKQRRPFRYRIVVAEQVQTPGRRQVLFNKGRILNTAIKYAMDTFERIDCIVIHDVDILPLWDSYMTNDFADYRCNIMPVHLTKRVLLLKTRKTRLYNQFLTGGVLSLRPQHILAANGYSNEYFGWGGEDDDWTLRMFNKNLCIMRPQEDDKKLASAATLLNKTNSIRRLNILDPDLHRAFFLMLDHAPSQANSKRFNSLTNALSNQMYDGFNTIEGLTRIVERVDHRAFTHLQIEVV